MKSDLRPSFPPCFVKKSVAAVLFASLSFVFVPVAGAQEQGEGSASSGLPGLRLPDLPPVEALPSGSDTLLGELEGASAFAPLDEDDIFAEGEGVEEVPKLKEIEAVSIRREAFDAALQGLLPLRPGEIRELLEHFDRTQESVEVPVHPYPKPEVSVQTVSLDPGVKPLVVNVAHGHVTTINFVDDTGAPWPVENITWAGNFEVIEVEGSSEGDATFSNILRISPETEFAYGNMSIMMTGLRTPIIMTLETSRDIVHYRFDAIIPESGPFAQTPIIASGAVLSAGDEDLTSVLEGVVPTGAQRLAVSGVDGRTSAYKFNGLTYVRTSLTLLSPGWSASMASADGMHVYAMEDAPVLILSDNGRTVRARLSDREDVVDE